MCDRTIALPIYGIVVELSGESIRHTDVGTHCKSVSIYGSGKITSDLKEHCPYCEEIDCYLHCDESQAGGFEQDAADLETEEDMWVRATFNKKMDIVESYILARACRGLDIESPAEIEALETILDTIGNLE
jgi:hypothetical protein